MKSHILAGAIVALIASTPAEAATYLFSYSGKISSASDQNGIFADPGSLVGQDYSAVFTFQYPNPVFTTETPFFSSIFGGGSEPSVLSAYITIAGISFSIAGDANSQIIKTNSSNPGYDRLALFSQDKGFEGSSEIRTTAVLQISNFSTIFNSPLFDELFSYSVKPGDDVSGSFSHSVKGIADQKSTLINVNVERVSVSSAVPEPATWIMMLIGIGAAGVAMRRGRIARPQPQS